MQESMLSDVFARIESGLNPSHSRTGIHDPSAPVAAISTVDREIDSARQFVRSLLTRRNALVPISHLPPEILSRVFHILVFEEPPLSGRRKLPAGWIRVTHVCRHWRQVALDDSSLWAKIRGVPANTKWISEMLARAKNAPLDIEFGAVTTEALLMIPPHLSHTRQLRFHSQSTLHIDRVREIYSCEAPVLEHFELTVTSYSNITFPDLSGNMLFKGRAPRLRTFSLSRVIIPWSLVPRGQLTQLKLACLDEDVDFPGDLNQFIDLLVNCPVLETLALDSCLPSQLTELSHGRTIHLPHLSLLLLCGSTSRIMNMLEMLKLPSSTTLHLKCISESEITSIHNDSEGLLLAAISAQFRSPFPVEFKSLTVTIQRDMTNSLKIIASTFPSTMRNPHTLSFESDIVGDAELVLSFDRLSNSGHSTDLLEQACEMLPISNLEYIYMSATHIIDINWIELFGCCTNVTTLQAVGLGTSNLVRALTAPTVTNAGSSKKRRKRKHDNRESSLGQPVSTVAHAHAGIFPELEFLVLTELDFAEGILFDIFKRGLQQRMAASGVPLELLHISNCKISIEDTNDLLNLVKNFEWDENEGFISRPENFDNYEEPPYDPWEVGFVGHCTTPHAPWDCWYCNMDRQYGYGSEEEY